MDTGLLLIRLVIGSTVAAHGAQKLFGVFGGYGLKGTSAFLDELGFRPGRVYAWLLAGTETIAGLALVLGFVTPLAAAGIAGVLFTAAISVHWSKGFFVQNGGFEYPLALAATALGVAFAGPGKASLDHAFDWHLDGVGWGIVAIAIGAIGAAVVDLSRVWQLHHSRGAHPAST